MEFDYLHEVESVVLQSHTKQSCKDLWKLFKEQGFTLHDDVFSLDRPKRPKAPPWQSDTYVEVEMCNDQKEVYEPDAAWDTVVLRYLLATQPRSGIAVFSEHAAVISARLNLPMLFRGKIVTKSELEAELNAFADELTAALDEAGSEGVAIVIASTYPRQRT